MKLKLTPQYRFDEISVVRIGDVLMINGVDYDFGPLPDGATLPAEAIGCDNIVGPVERIDGQIVLTLIAPIQRSIFLDPLPDIIDPPDGPIALPVIKELEVEQ